MYNPETRYNHTNIFNFITMEAVKRNLSLHIDFVLNYLDENDPIRKMVVWVCVEKGYDYFISIGKIPLEEVREKMREVGFPTDVEELGKATFKRNPFELTSEEIKFIADNPIRLQFQ